MKRPIYLDYHATTPVDPRVLERMIPYFTEHFGNAASMSHSYGRYADAAVQVAREHVAELIDAEPAEIIFTSGATEANNLAILGVAQSYAHRGKHFITAETEHSSVLACFKELETHGFHVTYLPVNQEGQVSLGDLENTITKDTVMVSLMAVNNEIGTIAPLHEIAKICESHHVLFHTDAVQALGKIAISAKTTPFVLLSGTSHKMYGPKGIGFLYIRQKQPPIALTPQVLGGGHEKGLRAGTLNVPAIVGVGEAARLARLEQAAESKRMAILRDHLQTQILSAFPKHAVVNGPLDQRVCGNLNVSFLSLKSSDIILGLQKDVAISSGSACVSGNPKPSHVLESLHVGENRTQGAVRFSLGRFTTLEDVDYAALKLQEIVHDLLTKTGLFA